MAAIISLVWLLSGAVCVEAQPQYRDFVFAERNRSYPDLQVTPQPAAWGPVQVHLSAPRASLQLSEHLVRLTPRPDGSHDVWSEFRFSGSGTLVADLEVAGMSTRKTDQVQLPRQAQVVVGRMQLERGPDAFRVTPLEMPRELRLQIQSRLAGDLVAWCASLPLVSLTGSDCSGLRSALSQVTVPLPPPGETYLVPYSELTPPERKALDDYLDAVGAP